MEVRSKHAGFAPRVRIVVFDREWPRRGEGLVIRGL